MANHRHADGSNEYHLIGTNAQPSNAFERPKDVPGVRASGKTA